MCASRPSWQRSPLSPKRFLETVADRLAGRLRKDELHVTALLECSRSQPSQPKGLPVPVRRLPVVALLLAACAPGALAADLTAREVTERLYRASADSPLDLSG